MKYIVIEKIKLPDGTFADGNRYEKTSSEAKKLVESGKVRILDHSFGVLPKELEEKQINKKEVSNG